jgi:hypothetical protein
VKSAMRFRRSSKLKSTDGSCVSGLSAYDIGGALWDCEVRNEDVLAEKDGGGIVVAILRRDYSKQMCWFMRRGRWRLMGGAVSVKSGESETPTSNSPVVTATNTVLALHSTSDFTAADFRSIHAYHILFSSTHN